jgi:hypothetical protein
MAKNVIFIVLNPNLSPELPTLWHGLPQLGLCLTTVSPGAGLLEIYWQIAAQYDYFEL